MFWNFDQNNSGGEFLHTKNKLSHIVIIEADSEEEAFEKAEYLGIYFDGVEEGYDCPCCGDRWYRPWNGGTETPQVYGSEVTADGFYFADKFLSWMSPEPEGYLHYKDGRVLALHPCEKSPEKVVKTPKRKRLKQ